MSSKVPTASSPFEKVEGIVRFGSSCLGVSCSSSGKDEINLGGGGFRFERGC